MGLGEGLVERLIGGTEGRTGWWDWEDTGWWDWEDTGWWDWGRDWLVGLVEGLVGGTGGETG